MKDIIEASPSPSAFEGKGRVLRLKCGYNPNSSSYGSIVFVMPGALLAATAVFGAVAGLIGSTLVRAPAHPSEGEGSDEEPGKPDAGVLDSARNENSLS